MITYNVLVTVGSVLILVVAHCGKFFNGWETICRKLAWQLVCSFRAQFLYDRGCHQDLTSTGRRARHI